MHVDLGDLIPLKEALYGREGLFPDVRRADVRERVGPIIRRKAWVGYRLRTEWLRREDVEQVRAAAEK